MKGRLDLVRKIRTFPVAIVDIKLLLLRTFWWTPEMFLAVSHEPNSKCPLNLKTDSLDKTSRHNYDLCLARCPNHDGLGPRCTETSYKYQHERFTVSCQQHDRPELKTVHIASVQQINDCWTLFCG